MRETDYGTKLIFKIQNQNGSKVPLLNTDVTILIDKGGEVSEFPCVMEDPVRGEVSFAIPDGLLDDYGKVNIQLRIEPSYGRFHTEIKKEMVKHILK